MRSSPKIPLATAEKHRLGNLLAQLQPRLTAVAYRFTRDPETARDVVQNAFEKAIRHRHQFEGRSRISTWVHRIVANEALMWLRSERRRSERYGELADWEREQLADPGPDPSEDLAARRDRARVRAEVAALAPEERDVIERCVLQGRSYGDYGAETGIHPAAAKSRAFRARRRLSAALAES